ncbi:MAG TPA: crossover junction endodeoxyribonuclease RuvC [Patescibacteria group bacterium]|nr:crossover junction endodeoxyribonuclease RuvC [Patescibacteria group bacterium]
MNPMRILGIDPGSAICGWGVIEKDPKTNRVKLVDCGCIKTHASSSTAERLKLVYDGIAQVIKKYKPSEVAVEELFFVQNVKTGIVVGQARGVLLLTAALAGKPVFEYKPTQIKLALVGYGRADKKQVQNMVKLVLKLDKPISQDDTADALAVAVCHLQSRNSFILHAKALEQNAKVSRESENEYNLPSNGLVYPKLSYEIVGALFDTYKQLGAGLPEKYYYKVFASKLKNRGIKFQGQFKVSIDGLPVKMGRFMVDFIIENSVVVEIKVGQRFLRRDVDQVMNYLRHSGLKLGLLARFGQGGVETRRLLLGNKI